jgi:VWFA-related protein
LHCRGWCLASGVLVVFAAISLGAQTSVPDIASQVPIFKTDAQAVSVDVVVTRGKGEPVAGLHQQDFEVLEDGKPQLIDLFVETSEPNAAFVAPQPLGPHVFTNKPAAPRNEAVNVLLLDSLNTAEADQARVRKQILDFLQTLKPQTLVAIFTLNTNLRLLQGFTSEKTVLQAALSGKAAVPGSTPDSHTHGDDLRDKEELSIIGEMANTGGGDADAPLPSMKRSMDLYSSTQAGKRATLTLAALQQLSRALAAIPGRKNVLWFASSFPISVFPNGSSRQVMANGQEISDAVRITADMLTQSKIALYPIAAQGVLIDATTDAESVGQPLGDNFERNPLQQSAANSANVGAMEQLAHDTGGAAQYTSNDLSHAIARVIENGSHYYTLVYTPPSAPMDGRFHRIEVRLTQEKASLEYRRGYYADDEKAAKISGDPLPALLARGMPASTQVVYQLRVLPDQKQPASGEARAGGNTKLDGALIRYKVDFVLSANSVTLSPAPDGTHTGKVELALVAYDAKGAALNWTGNTLSMSLNAAAFAQVQHAGIPLHLQIDLPASTRSLSSGVYDLDGRKAGTLEIAFESQGAASADAAPSAVH